MAPSKPGMPVLTRPEVCTPFFKVELWSKLTKEPAARAAHEQEASTTEAATAIQTNKDRNVSTLEHPNETASDDLELMFEQELDEDSISNPDRLMGTIPSFEAAKISGVDIDKIYGRVKEIVKTTCENIPDNKKATQ